MYILKNNKLPKLHLKLNGYKIKSKNDKVIEYRKTIVSKDKFNYGMFYFIHIFYHLQDNLSNVCVSTQRYIQDWKDWGYDWYSGKYEKKSIPIIEKYDKKLLKYIEYYKEESNE